VRPGTWPRVASVHEVDCSREDFVRGRGGGGLPSVNPVGRRAADGVRSTPQRPIVPHLIVAVGY